MNQTKSIGTITTVELRHLREVEEKIQQYPTIILYGNTDDILNVMEKKRRFWQYLANKYGFQLHNTVILSTGEVIVIE